MMKRAPDHVRYLGRFGEHTLTRSFTARDPCRTSSIVGRRELELVDSLLLLHASPTTPKAQDDILPSAYTRRSLANRCGENFYHPGYAKRVPGRTAPRGERSTTNRARAVSPRSRSNAPEYIGCRTYA